jgi:D-tyrosyl-tRNA(Tyr) deacylase
MGAAGLQPRRALSPARTSDGRRVVLAVVQRVRGARVRVAGSVTGEIGTGLLVLLGVRRGDDEADAAWMAARCSGLRVFQDAEGKMNRGLEEVLGSILVVSQFTLLGDCSKGRRPSFIEAAPPEEARRLYERFVAELTRAGVPVETGVFQAMMEVELINDGPVTLLLDSRLRERRPGGADA